MVVASPRPAYGGNAGVAIQSLDRLGTLSLPNGPDGLLRRALLTVTELI